MGSGAWAPREFGTRSPSRLWPAEFSWGRSSVFACRSEKKDDELPAAVGHRDEWALRTDERASVWNVVVIVWLLVRGMGAANGGRDSRGRRGRCPARSPRCGISGSQREPGHGSDKPSTPQLLRASPTRVRRPGDECGGELAERAGVAHPTTGAQSVSLAGLPADAAARLRARVRFLARLISVVSFTAACAGGTRPMVAAGATVRLPTPGHAVLRNPLGCMAVTLRSDAPRHNVPQPQC